MSKHAEVKKSKLPYILTAVILFFIVLVISVFMIYKSSIPTIGDIYKETQILIANKEYDLAEDNFELLEEHENLSKLKEMLYISKYEDAVEAEDYEEAEKLLENLASYEKYAELKNELTFLKGKKAYELEDYVVAQELLLKVTNNKDAENMLNEITFMKAMEAKSKGDYKKALELLKEIPSHLETESEKTDIMFKIALEEIELGDYKEAYYTLMNIPEHPSSESLIEIIMLESKIFEFIGLFEASVPDSDKLDISNLSFLKLSEEKEALLIEGDYSGEICYALFTDFNDILCDRYFIKESTLENPGTSNNRVLAAVFKAYMKKETVAKLYDKERVNKLLGNGTEIIYIENQW